MSEEKCNALWLSLGTVIYCQRKAVWRTERLDGGVVMIDRRCRRHRLRARLLVEERIR